MNKKIYPGFNITDKILMNFHQSERYTNIGVRNV